MTILTLDAGTSSQLKSLSDLAEIRDQSGCVIGYFHPVTLSADSGGEVGRSPFTIEELRERQKQRTGKPLAEILAKLQTP